MIKNYKMDSVKQFKRAIKNDDLDTVRQLYLTMSNDIRREAIFIAARKGMVDIVEWLAQYADIRQIYEAFAAAINTENSNVATWIWNDNFGTELTVDDQIIEEHGDELLTILESRSQFIDKLSTIADEIIIDNIDTDEKIPVLDFLADHDVYPTLGATNLAIVYNEDQILDWLLDKQYVLSVEDIDSALQQDNSEILDVLGKHKIKIPDDAYQTVISEDAVDSFIWLRDNEYPMPDNIRELAKNAPQIRQQLNALSD